MVISVFLWSELSVGRKSLQLEEDTCCLCLVRAAVGGWRSALPFSQSWLVCSARQRRRNEFLERWLCFWMRDAGSWTSSPIRASQIWETLLVNVFFSIGSRPSSLFECLIWIRDECRFGATVLITSQRHICTVEPVQLFACVQGQGHESCRTGSRRNSEMKRWKVDRNTDAKFLGSLLCSYCNLFVLNVAERCVVIPSLWWITLYSTSSGASKATTKTRI